MQGTFGSFLSIAAPGYDVVSAHLNGVLFGLLIIVITLYLVTRHRSARGKLPYPPGPWGFPVVGHLPLLGRNPLETLKRYRAEYGDVFSIQMGSHPTVVLNGIDVIKSALTVRPDDIAGRPKLYTANLRSELRGTNGLAFSTYDSAWKVHHRIANSALRMFAGYRNNPVEETILEESGRLVDYLLKQNGRPFDPREETALCAGSVIYQILFGRHSNIREDKNYCRMVKSLKDFVEFANAGNPIDVMPWTRYIFRGRLRRFVEITEVGLDVYKQQMKRHAETFDPSDMRDVTDALIHASEKITQEEINLGLTRARLNAVISEMLGAGSETVGTTLLWSFVRMATSPEAQAKVHAEIDRHLGSSRNPTYEDRRSMPYVEATILEVLRLGTITPLGIPHTNIREVEVNGYRIPKNTFILINLASTCNDPQVWEDPTAFKPGRFLKDGCVDKSKADMVLSFGAGRRRCLGEFLAKVELFVFFTSIMQRCSFAKAPGEVYTFGATFGLTMKPKPYRIIVNSRLN